MKIFTWIALPALALGCMCPSNWPNCFPDSAGNKYCYAGDCWASRVTDPEDICYTYHNQQSGTCGFFNYNTWESSTCSSSYAAHNHQPHGHQPHSHHPHHPHHPHDPHNHAPHTHAPHTHAPHTHHPPPSAPPSPPPLPPTQEALCCAQCASLAAQEDWDGYVCTPT